MVPLASRRLSRRRRARGCFHRRDRREIPFHGWTRRARISRPAFCTVILSERAVRPCRTALRAKDLADRSHSRRQSAWILSEMPGQKGQFSGDRAHTSKAGSCGALGEGRGIQCNRYHAQQSLFAFGCQAYEITTSTIALENVVFVVVQEILELEPPLPDCRHNLHRGGGTFNCARLTSVWGRSGPGCRRCGVDICALTS